jgi:hypothetical protein
MQRTTALVVCAGLASILAACGAAQQVAGYDTTLDYTTASGKPLDVTLTKVIDPVLKTKAHPAPGTRFVGVVFVTDNPSAHGASLDLDVSGGTILITAGGKSLSPSSASLDPICVRFPGQLRLTAGDAVSGCVAFEVRSSVQLARVRFSPFGGTPKTTNEWTIP